MSARSNSAARERKLRRANGIVLAKPKVSHFTRPQIAEAWTADVHERTRLAKKARDPRWAFRSEQAEKAPVSLIVI
jgi:hypothetical protein